MRNSESDDVRIPAAVDDNAACSIVCATAQESRINEFAFSGKLSYEAVHDATEGTLKSILRREVRRVSGADHVQVSICIQRDRICAIIGPATEVCREQQGVPSSENLRTKHPLSPSRLDRL